MDTACNPLQEELFKQQRLSIKRVCYLFGYLRGEIQIGGVAVASILSQLANFAKKYLIDLKNLLVDHWKQEMGLANIIS